MRLITEGILREMANQSKVIHLDGDCILSPSAKDLATLMGLTIIHEKDRYITRGSSQYVPLHDEAKPQVSPEPPAAQAAPEVAAEQESDLGELVKKVIADIQKPVCPNPRATHVQGAGVEVPPFYTGQHDQKIGLANVITSQEANLAAGFMTFDHSELPWHMSYDEVNYVIEGEYVLKIDDKVFKAQPGDVIYIPKGTNVVFSSPSYAKVFYVTYPANWDELSKQQ